MEKVKFGKHSTVKVRKMKFEVKGVFRKKNEERKYSKEIEAGSEALEMGGE